ncbi:MULTISPECIES: VanZ family protein [unclassified Leifsonia]|uniref:VanZ family protein n=1 Tax=unclassified Leifsonia TaxID=2663824 RepID=UPI0006FBBFF0|nr:MULTISPECIES: VanZ family protein [unclassified Leifsonia]KQX07635.1 hypothetical protein ASC59_07845 [Leifsonia sp. Root1293]KRA11917.1 hypothetical protein ASD61_07845 [Leifsonia sp. Root60]
MTAQAAGIGLSRAIMDRLTVLFGIYLGIVVWAVLWKLGVPSVGSVERVIKIVPFVATATNGANRPFEVMMNLVLFVPFGVYLGLLRPLWPWWRAGAAVAGTSLLLEIMQFILATGSTDATDVVVNTAGGLLGLRLLTLTRRRFSVTDIGVARLCAIGTVVLVLVTALLVAAPLHFAPPGVGHVEHSVGDAPGAVEMR